MKEPILLLLIECSECGYVFTPQATDIDDQPSDTTSCHVCGLKMPNDSAQQREYHLGRPPSLDTKFRFTATCDFSLGFMLDVDACHEAVQPAVKSFIRNMRRVSGVTPFFAFVAGAGAFRAFVDGEHRHTGKPRRDIHREFENTYDSVTRMIHLGLKSIDDIVSRGGEPASHAVESMLASFVIGAWTAFEALVEDLWIQCLNARPRLGFIAIDAGKDEKEKRKKLGIAHWMIQADDEFIVQKNMGRILQEVWNFSRRNEAADAYYKSFREDAASTALLKSIFDSVELQWLAETRNLLIHDGGVVSKRFRDEIGSHGHFGKLTADDDGQQIQLTGEIVCGFVDTATGFGVRLIKCVDGWLKDNPK